jgi:hypothetical protein
MSQEDVREFTVKGEGDAGDFKLSALKLDALPGLKVTTTDPRDLELQKSSDFADHQLESYGVDFWITVTVPATAASGMWRVGWIQTIYPCHQSATYQDPSGKRQGKMTATVANAMSDGIRVRGEHKGHWAWAEDIDDIATCEAGGSVTAKTGDQPNVAFHRQYQGNAVEWIKGWKAVATSGTSSFCTWLVAEAPDGTISYLYHVVWHVDFGTTLKDGTIAESTGGTFITGQGPGKGDLEPCIAVRVISDQEPPYLPDQDLLAANPAAK